jgi:transglutaminase-like putative cysteine protease
MTLALTPVPADIPDLLPRPGPLANPDLPTDPAGLADLLRPTEFLDYTHPAVREFVAGVLPDPTAGTPTERACALYYAVRDKIQYEVYDADLSREGVRASSIIQRGKGFCVHKSIVYAAVARAVGVPSRLLYGDVRNHLASPRLIDLVGGDVFLHALNRVYLNGKWVKATPVFSKLLCRLYKMTPLDFDGENDSLYHPYDDNGRRHMEFLRFRGEYDDFPYDMVVGGMRSAHPKLVGNGLVTPSGSLVAEAA